MIGEFVSQNLYMDEKFLRKLLKNNTEPDWLDFKRKLKLYSVEGKLNTEERDELIKDILGLANGNSQIIRKTKYLIIGADDQELTTDGLRVLHNVDYQVPTQSEINKWMNSACTPAVVGIECGFETIDNHKLYIITIPPTFDLHETTRELNAKGHRNKYTVFMRQGEHIVPASVRDGITIQQLKLLHRQETLNPSTIIFGAIIGAFIAILFWNSGFNASKSLGESKPIVWFVAQVLLIITGGFLGGNAGWMYREFKSLQYDWRYWSIRQKIMGLFMGIVVVITVFILWPR